MNERIRELLKQATQYADSLGPIDGAEWCDAEYSKFAELIKQAIYDDVKEELIPDDVITEEQPQLQEYLKGCNSGTVDALCNIKNFGVDIDDKKS
jgi:hypothetical protein